MRQAAGGKRGWRRAETRNAERGTRNAHGVRGGWVGFSHWEASRFGVMDGVGGSVARTGEEASYADARILGDDGDVFA